MEIARASNHPSERSAETQLKRLLAAYDLDAFVFTDRVRIDRTAIPHSHPVLTLNTRHIDDDALQLATFLHEQMHWYVSGKGEVLQAAITDLRAVYPDAPIGGVQGGRDDWSTYLHLIINMMEFDVLSQIIGRTEARQVLQRKDYYRWIYGKVLGDEDTIRAVMRTHGLAAPGSG